MSPLTQDDNTTKLCVLQTLFVCTHATDLPNALKAPGEINSPNHPRRTKLFCLKYWVWHSFYQTYCKGKMDDTSARCHRHIKWRWEYLSGVVWPSGLLMMPRFSDSCGLQSGNALWRRSERTLKSTNFKVWEKALKWIHWKKISKKSTNVEVDVKELKQYTLQTQH